MRVPQRPAPTDEKAPHIRTGLRLAWRASAMAATALAAGGDRHLPQRARHAAKRAQMVMLGRRANCKRGGSLTRFRSSIGKRTDECAYRTPVIGRDLEVFGTVRLLTGTPSAAQAHLRRADLRAGAGGKYQLAVFPAPAQVPAPQGPPRRHPPGTSRSARASSGSSTTFNKANELRLRAFNITSGANKGGCRVARLHQRQAGGGASPTRSAASWHGRYSGFSVGSSEELPRARSPASTTSSSGFPTRSSSAAGLEAR